jgi:hypothetical protein
MNMNQNELHMYVMAGVATAPHFMEPLREALAQTLTGNGRHVHSRTIFPYGDWGTRLLRQLREIRYDLSLRPAKYARSIGGNRILQELRESPGTADVDAADQSCKAAPILLVGHSGGGLAAVHAADTLLHGGFAADVRIVMIGSPKCRIPEALQDRVLYLYAASRRRYDRPGDPICRLGSWGGWHTGGPGLPRWRRNRHAPAHIAGLPLLGGHADYFRSRSPFMNADGESNLDVTMRSIWTWPNRS